MRIQFGLALAGLLLLLFASLVGAEGVDPGSGFGGPNAVPNQIESDALDAGKGRGTSVGERWDNWKKNLQDDYGFGLGMDYTGLYFVADEAQGLALPTGTQSDKAAAGNLRLFGAWDLMGRDSGNTGTFVWKVESRHNYSSSPTPARTWAALDLGYVGLIGPPYQRRRFSYPELLLAPAFFRRAFLAGRWHDRCHRLSRSLRDGQPLAAFQ